MIKFSIITICYNEVKNIERTINSVLEQTYDNYELIVIDGNSTDGTKEVLKKYKSVKKVSVSSEPDDGLYNAMNKGIDRSTGDYLFFLNGGDFFNNKSVLSHAQNIMEKTRKDIYYGKAICVAFQNKNVYPFYNSFNYPKNRKQILANILAGTTPHHQTIFCRRTIMVKHKFDENYMIAAEYNWFVTCLKKKYSMEYMNLLISNYTFGGLSCRTKIIRLRKEELNRIFRKKLPFQYFLQNMKKISERSTDKFQGYYYLLNSWLLIKEQNRSLEEYFLMKQWKTIAVYGMGIVGNHLLAELENTTIEVAYAIDRYGDGDYSGVKVIMLDEDFVTVDAIVVTTTFAFENIEKQLRKKTNCPIISLEDIVYSYL